MNDIENKKKSLEEVRRRRKNLTFQIQNAISHNIEVEGMYNNLSQQVVALKEENSSIITENLRISDNLQVYVYIIQTLSFFRI